MLTRIITLMAAFLLSACAPMMTKQDVAQIRNVAVIHTIKNEMAFVNRGLTIFGNSSSVVDISEWQLSEYVLDSTVKSIKSKHPEITLTRVPMNADSLNQYSFPTDAYLDELKTQGYDTALVIHNAGIYTAMGGGSYLAPPAAGGFIYYTTSFMGNKFRNQLFPQVGYQLQRLADKKFLSFASNNMEYPKEIETITAKPFDQYTPQEKELIKQEFIKNINATLDKSITKLFTVQSANN
jgi:hypothetical protein